MSKITETLSFDRLGIGFSDPGAGTRDAATLADELFELQTAVALDRPSILVCHSIAGPHCLVFAAKYPGRVAGLVLVDPHHPDETQRVSADAAEEDRRLFEVYPASLFRRSIFGFLRLRGLFHERATVEGHEQILAAVSVSASHWRGVSAEGVATLGPTLEETRIALRRISDLPISVISSSTPVTSNRPIVQNLQRQLVSSALPSRYEIVPGVSHEGLLTERAGVDAIVQMATELLRAPSGLTVAKLGP